MMNEEDFTRYVKMFIGLTLLPLKIAVDTFTELAESFQMKPENVTSNIIDIEISALKALNKLVEKQIRLLEEYKGKIEGKTEKIKVE